MKTQTLHIILCFFAFTLTQAQSLNTEINSEGEQPFLLGKIDKTGLTSKHYNQWFSKNYEDYTPDDATVKAITTVLKDYNITLFMGTWCGDSKQEVPRFYKILEACNFPKNQLTVIAVSREAYMYKQSPNHEEAGLNIHRVPTFIFYKNRKEVNRIIEHPIESLEKDILKIVTTNNYEPNYQIVTKVNAILKSDGLNGLQAATKKLSKTYKNKVKSMYELNTYGRILYATNRIDEAIEVFKLNTKLFPKTPNTYMSLANTLGISGNPKEGIKVLEKAILLFPENKDLIENLETLQLN